MGNNVKWLGHAAFEVTTARGCVILIDPWYEANPANPVKLAEVKKADLILVTHAHYDHLGDAMALTRQTGATLVVQPELARKAKEEGVPAGQIVKESGMNIGGTVDFDGVRVTMVQAFHTAELGSPAGYILTLEDGKTLYHAGDTGVFSSMELFGQMFQLDLALLPVGGCVTMDPAQAAVAISLLKPKTVIPMHYKTFPKLISDPGELVTLAAAKTPQVQIVILNPGESYTL